MRRSGTSAKEGRGRGRDRGSSWDSQSHTRKGYECGKIGHIRPTCPDLSRNKKKHDNPKDYACSAVAFVASLDHGATLPAHTDDVETTWVVDIGANCHKFLATSPIS